MTCTDCFTIGALVGAALMAAFCVVSFTTLQLRKPRPPPPAEPDSE